MNTDFGTVSHEGLTLTLTQQAYLDRDPEGVIIYRASAVDTAGTVYRVLWRQVEGFAGSDESSAADWEHPDRIDVVP